MHCAMYSVSIASFGAVFVRPLTCCFMHSKARSVVKSIPSRCFVIKSAGLTVPRIFSILSSWFFSFCFGQELLGFHVFDGLMAQLTVRRASPSAAAASVQIRTRASCPSSRVAVANLDGLMSHIAPCCSSRTRALLSDTTFCVDDQVANVC